MASYDNMVYSMMVAMIRKLYKISKVSVTCILKRRLVEPTIASILSPILLFVSPNGFVGDVDSESYSTKKGLATQLRIWG